MLLGNRLTATVREQSAERLAAALGVLQAQFAADGDRLAEKLALLSADPRSSGTTSWTRRAIPACASTWRRSSSCWTSTTFAWWTPPAPSWRTAPRPRRAACTPGAMRSRSSRLRWRARAGTRAREPSRRVAAWRWMRRRRSSIATSRWDSCAADWCWIRCDWPPCARRAVWTWCSGTRTARVVASTLPGAAALGMGSGLAAKRVTLGGRAYLARTDTLAPGPGAAPCGSPASSPRRAADATLARTAYRFAGAGARWPWRSPWSWDSSGRCRCRARSNAWPSSRSASRAASGRSRWRSRACASCRRWSMPSSACAATCAPTANASIAGERQAAYGQMARKVAHEIKNPLTPIAISVADLKRSYEQQRPDFPQILDQAVRTIDEEVHVAQAPAPGVLGVRPLSGPGLRAMRHGGLAGRLARPARARRGIRAAGVRPGPRSVGARWSTAASCAGRWST